MKNFYLLLTACTLFLGCAKEYPPTDTSCNCSVTIACTEEFRTEVIMVTDTLGNPVYFDSTITRLAATGEVIYRTPLPRDPTPHEYHGILDDGAMGLGILSACTFKAATFYGYQKGEVILTYNFKAKHDCCHIQTNEDRELEVVI